MGIVRLRLLIVLALGLTNIAAWYGLAFWGLNAHFAVFILVLLPVAAGWCEAERPWGIVLILLIPVLFIGGERHGKPWHWLICPLLWPYFAVNMGPVILGYRILVELGRWLTRRLNRTKRVNLLEDRHGGLPPLNRRKPCAIPDQPG